MISAKIRTAVMAALVGGTAAACGAAEAPPTGDSAAVTITDGGAPAAMQHDMAEMNMDPAVQRHAQEADSMAAVLRDNIDQMRQLSAAEQHARIGEHVAHIAGMLSLMDRHMREMDHGMGMDDAHMGEMMGMSGEEHRQMMEQMRILRADAEQLQTASQADVAQLMPAHLDRLGEMVRHMEQSAGHMQHP